MKILPLIVYGVGMTLLFLALLMSSGCSMELRPGEMRKITAWGMWSAPMGMPLGVGYWHSERGPGRYIDSEQSEEVPR